MMTLEHRIETYLAQNGSESRLTFRQERRLRKAAHRIAKRDRKAVAERRKAEKAILATPPTETDLKTAEAIANTSIVIPAPVPCYTCGVVEGPCVTKSGKPAKANHKARA